MRKGVGNQTFKIGLYSFRYDFCRISSKRWLATMRFAYYDKNVFLIQSKYDKKFHLIMILI